MIRVGQTRRNPGARAMVSPSAAKPPAGFAYPLDASEATLQSFGFTGRLTLSNSDQTGDYLINDYGPTEQYAAAAQVGVTLPAGSGKHAVRWRIDQFTPSAGGVMRAQITFYDASLSNDLYHVEYYTFSGGTFQAYIVVNGATTVYTGPTTGAPFTFMDFAFDATANKLHIFDETGTELTLSNAGAFTPQAIFPLLLAVHGSGAYGATSPGHIKQSLLCGAADMAGATWLAGYSDFGGNPIT